ncbi:hypothetical protein AtubIFM55763_003521 [Aspergillus tubingensis]|uniref:C6 transcription factor n=1 Tax=Aspergillus niger TaxID=5061 RepID=A0A100IJB4_ASPNG|nr:C6 transcription factor [Aspergillus niger]GLA62211.1 hypothetical protein AtubIFM54640_002754 [Aspergillus tubingensis]GLA72639.1 hypothetical protein AtubIFM55763_003521 [Aspergillus tubingensis]GLA92293.1 hypothetical protein AtubIFM57143_007811 [Aspergillus tubingensis]GLB17459.1 hypothetical protein AtubIFM61612_007330 [Aspergillus tubingensis]
MRHRLTKRACDECISRKVKCSGAWPCDTCQSAPKQVNCTYLKPARRRGPKVRRYTGEQGEDRLTTGPLIAPHVDPRDEGISRGEAERHASSYIPTEELVSVVHSYQQASYSVWPVVDAEVLLEKLEHGTPDVGTLCLAMALCAATMAQLQLAPTSIDSKMMAAECMRMREAHLDLRSVLVSFFLHVYHAKINKRDSAMLFIREAVYGARLLKLDEGVGGHDTELDADVVANKEIVFLLLWVSERGYSLHLGLEPSYTTPIRLPDEVDVGNNADVKGLLELGRLFATFDRYSATRSNNARDKPVMTADSLAETETVLSMLSFGKGDRPSTRIADYCITKEWMRTIIWQEALSRHLLSSKSGARLMTFRFPAVVSRDLLMSLQSFTESDLLPLGRDQLLKCFEIANSLADTVLLTPCVPTCSDFQMRPHDFLHALYQKLLPFLEQDFMLKSILHSKTAEALVKAPARLLRLNYDPWSFDNDTDDAYNTGEEVDSPEEDVDSHWNLYG